ncbi:Putative S-adenosyl-L-methionine-dependent methyltransferase [Mycolicibacterium vanbaalenii]|uniref:S-adenosyl-L-methionine-dependent methyltransferase n=1 Tax=Mycolicibacterium vanbaalenii TaxID=110539 RepID=A0A5S9R247_MYCVN|nr:SAM-dependent methyltransferase [Mycolicibacterium vanbaalenii]CAA0125960.1 Putative S-adenosyl-L-methionine-dependent methyltransferase [Mycolicibacterium vanbaalenii]
MNPISKTAFFCCGIRADDARSPASICSDIYAEDFMTGEGMAVYAPFSGSTRRNASNVVRARIFYDEMARRLKANKDLQIINIGTGFDSRAYRLAGGRWFEFDEAAIIEHKNTILATESCPNVLRRIAVDFSAGELPAALRECDPTAETLIVIEGVFMYLDKTQVHQLLTTLSDIFPDHTLICDLMDRVFFDRHMGKLYEQIRALGSEFKFVEQRPEETFVHLGYRQPRPPVSIVDRAREFKAFRIPAVAMRTALRTLRDGYRVHTFERSS